MCGIAGCIWTDPARGIDEAVLERMTSLLTHRGPDDEGMLYSEFRLRAPYEPMPGVALGFRRLAIIDLETGNQPIPNEDKSIWVVFNGEIYNFPALRNRLQGSGHTFRTRSDSETIVHLYEDEGPDCFQHLNGMFAIAIWDSRHRRLVLGRDRLGQKPLYYSLEAGRLAFASQIKSLLEIPGLSRDIDFGAVDEYLTYQYIPHPNSIFRAIKKLSPGHRAVFEDGKLDIVPYWELAADQERPYSKRQASERIRELFTSAVEMRMRSDVPLGAFLSGGVDSSLVVAAMQRLSDERVKTFAIGFPEAEYDETRYARMVADHLGTDHHEFQVTPEATTIIPELIWHYDEPFADSSAIPTWYVSQQTREHVTVALSGDGGDELFAGYSRYKAVALARFLHRARPLRALLAWRLWQWLPGGGGQKSRLRHFKRFSAALSLPPAQRYLDWIAIFNESQRGGLYTDEFLESLPPVDPFTFLKTRWNRAGKRDAISQVSLADVQTYLIGDLNAKVDTASMAHGLECRQPFLDHRLVELAAALPSHLKYRRGRGKRILRDTFSDWIPAAIWRRPKMGFGVPLDHWFRNELKEMLHDTLLSDDALCHRYFRRAAIEQYLREHQDRRNNHSQRLWALLVFELWMKQWLHAPASVAGG